MPSYLKSDFDKMFIDESYKAFKRDDLKVVYSIKINNDQKTKKIISKIINLDEYNQFGFVMPMGVIKEKPSSNWKTFNLLLESVSIDDPTGHLFAVDKNLIMKMQQKNNFFLIKFYHQLLKNIKFWMWMKDLLFNF